MEKKEITNKPKDGVTNKPKDEIINKPREIKIEITCEIVDDGKTPKKEYVNKAATVAFWSFVIMIVCSSKYPVAAVFYAVVFAISFFMAAEKSIDRKINPEKYK